jgi:hypothetical protein
MQELQEQRDTLLKQSTALLASKQCEISERAETTYLNIIGGMLTLMLGQSLRCALFQLQNTGGTRLGIGRPLRRHHGHHGANLERQVRQRQEVRP